MSLLYLRVLINGYWIIDVGLIGTRFEGLMNIIVRNVGWKVCLRSHLILLIKVR